MPITKDENHIPKLKAKLKQLGNKKVRVGILGENELLMIGIVNEFGSKIKVTSKMRGYLGSQGLHLKKGTTHITIPERAFLRKAFDDASTPEVIRNAALKVLDDLDNLSRIPEAVGIKMTGIIRAKIKSNIQPPNHPFTTMQKDGKNKTLIDSGRLGQGISHKVV